MSDVLIRHGESNDVGNIMRVHRASILNLGLIAYSAQECESWAFGLTLQGYRDAMATGQETYLVAEVADQIVGFCSFKSNEIMGLFVDPVACRQGIGSQLLTMAEHAITAIGEEKIFLEAALSAEAFYVANGYSIVDRRPWVTRGNVEIEACAMEKSLQLSKLQ